MLETILSGFLLILFGKVFYEIFQNRKNNFSNQNDYNINHLMNDVNIQEQYMQNEQKLHEKYVLSNFEKQFKDKSKYIL